MVGMSSEKSSSSREKQSYQMIQQFDSQNNWKYIFTRKLECSQQQYLQQPKRGKTPSVHQLVIGGINVVYQYDEILLGCRKGMKYWLCYHMGKCWKYHVNRKKPLAKDHMVEVLWNVPNMQIDWDRRSVVAEGWGWGWGEWEVTDDGSEFRFTGRQRSKLRPWPCLHDSLNILKQWQVHFM